jgi:hypothetical protein
MYYRTLARDKRRLKAAAPVYQCQRSDCQAISVKAEALDEYVEDKIILWGSDPAVYAALFEAEDSAAGAAARADVARLEAELEETRQLFDDGEMSPVMAGRKEKKLLAELEDAEQRARDAVMPKVLADNIGPQFAHRWVNVLDIPAKKQILRAVAGIQVNPVGSGRSRQPVGDRVTWRWLLGDVAPAAGERDDQPALPEHHNRPPHRVDGHAVLGGQITLSGQPRGRPQVPSGDTCRDVVGQLHVDVHRAARVDGWLISHTAHGIARLTCASSCSAWRGTAVHRHLGVRWSDRQRDRPVRSHRTIPRNPAYKEARSHGGIISA